MNCGMHRTKRADNGEDQESQGNLDDAVTRKSTQRLGFRCASRRGAICGVSQSRFTAANATMMMNKPILSVKSLPYSV